MAEYLTNTTDLTKVSDAIREKGETTNALVFPDGFVSAIAALSVSELVTGESVGNLYTGYTIPALKGKNNFILFKKNSSASTQIVTAFAKLGGDSYQNISWSTGVLDTILPVYYTFNPDTGYLQIASGAYNASQIMKYYAW